MAVSTSFADPPRDCDRCPRLCGFRSENRRSFPEMFNAPVPAFGALDAALLIVGLAPGLRGANFTGRPFTADYAGDLLYPTLIAQGLATGSYQRHAGDGLRLINCRITNAVRCVPPQNKPTPDEINTCRDFLRDEILAMPHLKTIVALGQVSHISLVKTFGLKASAIPFGHGREAELKGLDKKIMLISSYHCSRYNTNTNRLTAAMFNAVIARAVATLRD